MVDDLLYNTDLWLHSGFTLVAARASCIHDWQVVDIHPTGATKCYLFMHATGLVSMFWWLFFCRHSYLIYRLFCLIATLESSLENPYICSPGFTLQFPRRFLETISLVSHHSAVLNGL